MSDKNRDERELGFGNIFKGLGNFVDILSDIVEKGESLKKLEGDIKKIGKADNITGKYGISVHLGNIDKLKEFTEFGKKNADKGSELITPATDVFNEGNEITVVAEIPGIEEEDITCKIENNIFYLYANRDNHKYYKEMELEDIYIIDKCSYKNGFVIIKLKRSEENG